MNSSGSFHVRPWGRRLRWVHSRVPWGSSGSFGCVNLLAPEKPTDKSFAEIVAAVKNHHQPQPSVILQRFNFHSRNQQSGENISTFVAELRKLSEHCNFGDTLNDMLQDRLLCGIIDQRVQSRLLALPDITFAKAPGASSSSRICRQKCETARENHIHYHSACAQKGGRSSPTTAD